MNNKQHVILGYGNLGKAVGAELESRGISYSVLERTNKNTPHFVQTDASDIASLTAATKNASHVYVTLGLPYSVKVWQQQWPVVMQNIIDAAAANRFVIVFFDNLYMYGPSPLQNPITEEHPQNPPSKKGIVRKQIADMLQKAGAEGKVRYVIGRSADFYGPDVRNSLLYINTLEKLLKGKKAGFVGNPYTKHSFTYVPDAGKGLVMLALDESTYGQSWHLPTAPATYTTEEILVKMAKLVNGPSKVSVMPAPMLAVLKLVIPILKEVDEMTYQTEHDYVFDSSKFMKKFPSFAITSYEAGIQAMVDSVK